MLKLAYEPAVHQHTFSVHAAGIPAPEISPGYAFKSLSVMFVFMVHQGHSFIARGC